MYKLPSAFRRSGGKNQAGGQKAEEIRKYLCNRSFWTREPAWNGQKNLSKVSQEILELRILDHWTPSTEEQLANDHKLRYLWNKYFEKDEQED